MEEIDTPMNKKVVASFACSFSFIEVVASLPFSSNLKAIFQLPHLAQHRDGIQGVFAQARRGRHFLLFGGKGEIDGE